MNRRIIAVTCALAAAACSGATAAQPAREPVSGAAPSDGGTTVASAADPGIAMRNTTAARTTTGAGVRDAPPNASPNGNSPGVVNNAGVADQTKDADNTKINKRDRDATLTPMNQGSSRAETSITANVRKGIMGDNTLSSTGKNVKVITVGSKVTLRGPVKSDQAKAAIGAIASQTAGVTEVDNQLEVKK